MLEIQRRPRWITQKDGSAMNSEENFQGFIFTLNDNDQIYAWLRKFLAKVRYYKGVVSKLVNQCPGKAAAFNHSRAKKDQVPCEAAIMNGLRQMGIKDIS